MTDAPFSKLAEVLAKGIPVEPKPHKSKTDIYQRWRIAAGDKIADNTIHLKTEDNILFAVVSSPVWAHTLINKQNRILESMRTQGNKGLTELSIRIHVPKVQTPPKGTQRSHYPRVVNEQMQSLYLQLAKETRDGKTKEVFERLSKLGPKKSD